MKRIMLCSFLLGHLFHANAQTLFTYGKKAVSRQEFLKAFNKNNTDEKPTEKLYRDYLELYIRFKIKVQAAFDMKLDTMVNQKTELNAFRSQVIDNYMTDDASMEILIQEAIDRIRKDIHLAHIFIPITKEATAAEVKNAQEKINDAYKKLQSGESFESVAASFSMDPSVMENKGDLGFITAFVLPYDLETSAYSTHIGKISPVFRSRIGFHILKNLGERKAVGKMRVAQILIAFPPDADLQQKQVFKRRADSIYSLLQSGGDFKDLAAQFSNDNLSYLNGGEMPEFGIGQYSPTFEAAAIALNKEGDLSMPFLTEYGYHIIRLIQKKPVIDDLNDKQFREEIRQQVMKSDRMEVSRRTLIKRILLVTALKRNPVDQQELFKVADSILQDKNLPVLKNVNNNTPLFSIGKQTIRIRDWIQYLQTIRDYNELKAGKSHQQLLEQFIETTAYEFYRDHLEEYDPEFAYQLKEFKEGNLLFEVMQRKIWDVATTDSAGLNAYYNNHKNKYWWETSADAIIFSCNNDSVAEQLKSKLTGNYRNWRQLTEGSNSIAQADSGRFELSQIPVAERTNFSPGLITANVKNEADNSVTFVYIIKIYSAREPRIFDEARGFVINDYQLFLEDKWVNELKKKYPVVVNESVFRSLPK